MRDRTTRSLALKPLAAHCALSAVMLPKIAHTVRLLLAIDILRSLFPNDTG